MFLSNRTVEEINRNLESLARDHSRAQATLTQTKSNLAEFVLLNSKLIEEGAPLDLSAYEDAIEDAEWTIKWSQEEFEKEKARLSAIVSQLAEDAFLSLT